jgi:hypothetical protein
MPVSNRGAEISARHGRTLSMAKVLSSRCPEDDQGNTAGGHDASELHVVSSRPMHVRGAALTCMEAQDAIGMARSVVHHQLERPIVDECLAAGLKNLHLKRVRPCSYPSNPVSLVRRRRS